MSAFMTKKHFDFIAYVFNSQIANVKTNGPHPSDVIEIATVFADALQQTNPLFKRDKFLQACTSIGVANGTDDSSSSNTGS